MLDSRIADIAADWPEVLIVARWPEAQALEGWGESKPAEFALVAGHRPFDPQPARGKEREPRETAGGNAGQRATAPACLTEQSAIIAALAGLDPIQLSILPNLPKKPEDSAVLVVGPVEVYLPISGMVDLDAERARLSKELAETAIADRAPREAAGRRLCGQGARTGGGQGA